MSSFFFKFYFWPCCEILIPLPGIEPGTSAVKHRVPTTWPPGNSQEFFFFLNEKENKNQSMISSVKLLG